MITFTENYYITTAIAYVNGKPHAGHMLEFIQADFLARYKRATGYTVHFLTGTDEHGQKIVESAEKAGEGVAAFVKKNADGFEDFTKLLNMSNDDFIRTSDQQRHWPSVVKLWKLMADKGDIYKKEYEGLYCVGCEKFITEKELDENGHCPNHKKAPKRIKEENYFFALSKYATQVKELIESGKLEVVPKTRRNEILSFLNEEVNDISFSRHKSALSWGIPVPDDEDQVMYVWCDALSNYMSALDYANESEAYKQFWPASVHMIGKDITRFHAVYWPAMHLSAGVAPPQRVFAHGFLNNKGQKMSKSLGNIIDPYEQIEKYGLDPLRLYLLKELPTGEDGDYNEDILVETVNNELANDLGNLIRRITVLIEKNFSGTIPSPGKLEEVDEVLIAASHIFEEFDGFVSRFEFNKAINKLWEFVHGANKYLTETEPWKVKDQERLGTILYNALEAARMITCYLSPIMPETAEKIAAQLGQQIEPLHTLQFGQQSTGSVQKGDILFEKIEVKKMDTFPINLKVAKVLEAENHPDADKLLVVQVDLGSEKRQIVAGLRGHYEPEELVGKHIVIVSNLKKAKLRGKESQGMLLAGEDDNGIGVVNAGDIAPGTPLTIEGLENSDAQITFDQFFETEIRVVDGHPSVDGKELTADGQSLSIEKVGDGARVR